MAEVMRAAVAERPGPPDVLAVREVPVPEPRDGWTLVQVNAAGLNRSEIMTRLGFSPNVTFPRILGVECVGVIAGSVNPALSSGIKVAAIMGEMGSYDHFRQQQARAWGMLKRCSGSVPSGLRACLAECP